MKPTTAILAALTLWLAVAAGLGAAGSPSARAAIAIAAPEGREDVDNSRSDDARVKEVRCEVAADQWEARCEIEIEGVVREGTAISFAGLPSDILRAGAIELGRTGYFMGRRFHASILPRLYPLSAVAGQKDPRLTLQINPVSEAGVYAPERTGFAIVGEEQAIGVYLQQLGTPVVTLALIIFILAFALARVQARGAFHDGWKWNSAVVAFFFVTIGIYCASMTAIPKAIILLLYSSRLYDVIFATNQVLALAALTELMRTTAFHDPTNRHVRRKAPFDGALIAANAFCLFASLWHMGATWSAGLPIYGAHSKIILIQAAIALASGASAARGTRWRSIHRRALPFGIAFAGALWLGTLIQLRDSIAFQDHSYANAYYNRHAYLFVIAMGALRFLELARLGHLAEVSSDATRAMLSALDSGSAKLSCISRQLIELGRGQRASIVSIRDDSALMLASEGDQARAADHTPKPVGRWLRLAFRRGRAVHVRFNSRIVGNGGERPSVVIFPIRQDGRWTAAITLTLGRGKLFSPRGIHTLRIASERLAAEVSAAIGQTVVEQKVRELEALAVCTSGIVFEQRDSWGRLVDVSPTTRRIIVSADGVKSTKVAELAMHSDKVRAIAVEYKRSLYAAWMAIKTSLELVSKDVRGDDFWALSPLEFKSADLRELGPEKTCLVAAYLIEERCRQISGRPEFAMLGRPGSHVAIGAGDVQFLALGTERAKCIDVDAPIMSRIHRIRSAANPGAMLVDVSDPLLAAAAADATLFVVDAPALPLGSPRIFADLHRLPEVIAVTGLVDHPIIARLRERVATELARDTLAGAKTDPQTDPKTDPKADGGEPRSA